MSPDVVKDIASSCTSCKVDSIANICKSRKYNKLCIIFNHNENKASFWADSVVPLEQFGDEKISITEGEILSLRERTDERPEVLQEYFEDIPKGYLELYIQYCLFVRKEKLLELGFLEENAKKLCEERGPIEKKILENFDLLEKDTRIRKQQEQAQSSVDKLVADIEAIEYPHGFSDFVRTLIDAFQRQDSVQDMTKDENHYKGLNRSLVYFWDDIVLLHEKSTVCATRLARLFQIGKTEFDMKEREYMRSVLDVCRRRTTTDWEHINKYLKSRQDVSGCVFAISAPNTAEGTIVGRMPPVPAQRRAAPARTLSSSAHPPLSKSGARRSTRACCACRDAAASSAHVVEVWRAPVYACRCCDQRASTIARVNAILFATIKNQEHLTTPHPCVPREQY